MSLVAADANVHELTARNGDVSLAGSLWRPGVARTSATLLMHPGSGPSDRDNDVLFPPIREHLLGAGIAVASFDKRGVGASTGHWQDAAIEEQAADALACLEVVREAVRTPVGLFGHSQGGWVVVEAAATSRDVAFVVTSSGPGVTPAAQERFAAQTHMARAGIAAEDADAVDAYYRTVMSMMRSGISLAEARKRVAQSGAPAAFETLSLPILPDDEAEWRLTGALIDYDPRAALERIEVPVLAIFGAEDPITPVAESVAVFQAAVHPELLQVEVFGGAGHRLQSGDPPAFVAGYLDTLARFVARAVA